MICFFLKRSYHNTSARHVLRDADGGDGHGDISKRLVRSWLLPVCFFCNGIILELVTSAKSHNYFNIHVLN